MCTVDKIVKMSEDREDVRSVPFAESEYSSSSDSGDDDVWGMVNAQGMGNRSVIFTIYMGCVFMNEALYLRYIWVAYL